MYSSSYQVPVLYFSLLDSAGGNITSNVEAVYKHLVPQHQERAVKEVGVLGGIGMVVGFHCS